MTAKKFKLDQELDTLGGWEAYGGVWRTYKGTAGVKLSDCTAEEPCLRPGGFLMKNDTPPTYEAVRYTVSNGHAVVTQGLDDAFHARLMAAAPDLLRFVRRVAEGEASTLGVVDEAKALIKSVREPVRVWGRHDSAYDPAGWPDAPAWDSD